MPTQIDIVIVSCYLDRCAVLILWRTKAFNIHSIQCMIHTQYKAVPASLRIAWNRACYIYTSIISGCDISSYLLITWRPHSNDYIISKLVSYSITIIVLRLYDQSTPCPSSSHSISANSYHLFIGCYRYCIAFRVVLRVLASSWMLIVEISWAQVSTSFAQSGYKTVSYVICVVLIVSTNKYLALISLSNPMIINYYPSVSYSFLEPLDV